MLFDENTPYDFKITCPLFADDLHPAVTNGPSNATPNAVPNSLVISFKAEATPCRSAGKEDVMVSVAGVMEKPIPKPIMIKPGNTDRYPVSTETNIAISIAPILPNAIPKAIVYLLPIRSANLGAIPELIIIKIAIGIMPNVERRPDHPNTP